MGLVVSWQLVYFICDLKLIQKNGQHNLTQELGHNPLKAIKNIWWKKSAVKVDYSIVTRWFKKFCSGCNTFDNQSMSSRPKTMGSVAVLQAIDANLTRYTQRVLGKLSILQSSVIFHFHDLEKKTSGTAESCLTFSKYCKTLSG